MNMGSSCSQSFLRDRNRTRIRLVIIAFLEMQEKVVKILFHYSCPPPPPPFIFLLQFSDHVTGFISQR